MFWFWIVIQQGAWRPKVSDVVTALALSVKHQTSFDVLDDSPDDDGADWLRALIVGAWPDGPSMARKLAAATISPRLALTSGVGLPLTSRHHHKASGWHYHKGLGWHYYLVLGPNYLKAKLVLGKDYFQGTLIWAFFKPFSFEVTLHTQHANHQRTPWLPALSAGQTAEASSHCQQTLLAGHELAFWKLGLPSGFTFELSIMLCDHTLHWVRLLTLGAGWLD